MAMRSQGRDNDFKLLLRDLPREHGNRYTEEVSTKLLQILFYNLADGDESYLSYFFPQTPPRDSTKPWNLSLAQGAIQGAEYSESARGRPCGHVFQPGEATYTCRTCTSDDTCVLCVRCFEASDHEGHAVTISHSHGIGGCCDCGDAEAWLRPLNCAIHSLQPGQTPPDATPTDDRIPGKDLPERLRGSIVTTVSRAIDYVCDVFSCAPEQMRTAFNEDAIRDNEVKSRLSAWYGSSYEPEIDNEFALILWNDEKHTFDEVQSQIAKACRMPHSKAQEIAKQVDAVGRCIAVYSRNVADLIDKARILAQIKLTITIRSARDTFREQMCQTIIEWLSDIAKCKVGKDPHFLMHVICEELVNKWRIGSTAFNLSIAEGGIIDNARTDDILDRALLAMRVREFGQLWRRNAAVNPQTADAGMTEDDEIDADESGADEDDVADDEEEDEDDPAAHDDDLEDIMEIDTSVDEFVIIPGEGIAQITASRDMDADEDDEEETIAESSEAVSGRDRRTAGPAQTDPNKLFSRIPTVSNRRTGGRPQAPSHWLSTSLVNIDNPHQPSTPLWADMHQRVRIDHLVFYDMRMWKTLRDSLRKFYIATVVTVPYFKRILSLRFAALYTHLSQLYLLADRESEHSIIQLSLQMLTTPSITEEVVKRSNFFTRLLAILYTFLTKRQVGEPEDVDPQGVIPFEQSIMTNRRVQHVFNDMNYLLEAPYVQNCIKTNPDLLLQWLDFAKLFQGVCPNRRAVSQHLEYESDAWFAASLLMKDVIQMSRKISSSFRWQRHEDPKHICRAIRQTAKVAIVSSLGIEHERFRDGELNAPVKFKTLPLFSFEYAVFRHGAPSHKIVDCVVDKSLMSFHHVVHYTLSWLIDAGKSMSKDQLVGLLAYQHQQLQSQETRSGSGIHVPEYEPSQYLLAVFDIPLRVCVWIAQMRARMWVRNGQTLRHQHGAYVGVNQRPLTHQRDVFMLQTAFVVCPPAEFLASVIDRFGMSQWVAGHYQLKEGHDEDQTLDVAEDFISLLALILCDRGYLLSLEDDLNPRKSAMQTDLIHTLCFKALTFSKISEKLSERVVQTLHFQEILQEVAEFRPPEGMADSGTWRLKDEYFLQLNPYYPYYNKSQREDAESLYRSHKARTTGLPLDQVFHEPRLRPIPSGVFQGLANFSQIPLFGQIIWSCLKYINVAERETPSLSVERVEAFLNIVLHLVLVAVSEDRAPTASESRGQSFLDWCFDVGVTSAHRRGQNSIIQELLFILQSERYQASRPRIRFVLQHLQQGRPLKFEESLMDQLGEGRFEEAQKHLLSLKDADTSEEKSLKKKQALARQAKVMAAFKQQQSEFMENQAIDWGVESESDSESMDYAAESAANRVWPVPSGTCILCQDETSDKQIYGTLAYFTESRFFRQTNIKDPDFVREVFATPRDLDRTAESIRPFGVAGENIERISKADPDGNQIQIERRGLGKGFPRNQVKPGPMVTGCGHIMHLSCFNDFMTSTQKRHQYQVTRCHPEVLALGEFVCPLCKALGNAFLPAIWTPRPKLEVAPPDTNAFDNWLASLDFEQPSPPNINRPVTDDIFRRHAREQLVANYLSEHPIIVTQEHSEISRGPNINPPGGRRYQTRVSASSLQELVKSYQRLRGMLHANDLPSRFSQDAKTPGPLAMTDALADSIGYSIAAVEAAQRGAQSETPIFVDSIPNQTLAQLRSLSETTLAYISLGSIQTPEGTLREINECCRVQYETLFCTRDMRVRPNEVYTNTPLLAKDPFVFAAACSVFLSPNKDIEIHGILRLCYLAEIVRVILGVLRDNEVVTDFSITRSVETIPLTSTQGHNFSSFVQSLIQQYVGFGGKQGFNLQVDENPNSRYRLDHLIRTMLSSYALPFVRKCVLLMSVRYGTDYSTFKSTRPDASELERLSEAIYFPSIDDMVSQYLASDPTAAAHRALVSSWISHWQFCCTEANRAGETHLLASKRQQRLAESIVIKLSHPGIYELVALPYTHDTLNSIAMSRRCPTTGRELVDPNVCLFCGDMFCGQASCCATRDNGTPMDGGCFRHQYACGGNIGMFINIRKCAILFLHKNKGSWFDPPYLDKHGEVDVGLKRREQLFLHSKRYDRLFRDVWLGFGGGVPSAVARKLEADINSGGWETL